MCQVAASKLSLHYFHLLYTDIFKKKVIFSTFQVKMLKKIKKSQKMNPDAQNFYQHRV
jgi:hypothetical protein